MRKVKKKNKKREGETAKCNDKYSGGEELPLGSHLRISGGRRRLKIFDWTDELGYYPWK